MEVKSGYTATTTPSRTQDSGGREHRLAGGDWRMGCCTTARGGFISSREGVLDHIRAERERQIAKYGDHRRDAGTWALNLNEETGEVARAAMECDP